MPERPDKQRQAPFAQQVALRRALFCGLLLSAFTLLAGRVVFIQGVEHARWSGLARRYHETRRAVPALRGKIVDRRGRPLAISTPVPSVFANPRAISDKEGVAAALAEVLKVDYDTVLERLHRPKFFVWIKRHISPFEERALAERELPGVYFRQESQRNYPYGTLAGHVLGTVGIDGDGLAGAELKFDRILSGRPGFELVHRDGRGRAIAVSPAYDRPPVHGNTLVLTLDAVIQQIAEDELAKAVAQWEAEGGAVVVLEAGTGQTLAMASYPAVDPNRYGSSDWNARLNRAMGMVFEPGSTFKPFVAAAALDCNVVQPDTEINCYEGRHAFGRRVLRDVSPHGILDLRGVIVKSSNIGIAQVGLRLGRDALHHASTRFGFGSPTGIELPGEESGILRPASEWTSYSMTSIPMGHELAVTVLGMAAAYNVFASDGHWIRPRLALGMARPGPRGAAEPFEAPLPRPVIRPSVANLMLGDFLAGAVEEGTGRRARIAGYSVGGKTGTAQVAKRDGRGYEPGAYISTFAGVSPVESPALVCMVMIERPRNAYYGGTVAAPVVASILERSLTYLGTPRQDLAAASAEGGTL